MGWFYQEFIKFLGPPWGGVIYIICIYIYMYIHKRRRKRRRRRRRLAKAGPHTKNTQKQL